MSINFPANRKEVSDRIKTDVQGSLPAANPFLKNSYLGALIAGFAGRIFDVYLQLQRLILEIFPNTADGIYLAVWGALVGVLSHAATAAAGSLTVTGTIATLVPSGTAFTSSTGAIYTSTADATIADATLTIATLTRSGTTAMATTSADHHLASGMTATISGASQAEYNVSAVITVTDTDRFTYTVAGSPATPATGAPVVNTHSITIPVTSDDPGQASNLPGGTQLTLQSAIAGVDATAYVQFSEIAGGTDIESDPDYFNRVNYRYQNPVSLFNVAAITTAARSVPGVTRVFVEPITPYPGAVTVYFTRNNDGNPIPDGVEVAAVNTVIQAIAPATTDPGDIHVLAPTPVTVDFTFTSLTPNNASMQTAIKNNLLVLFQEGTSVGQDLLALAYNAAIYQTIDTTTGQTVQAFVLSAPAGDVTIAAGELPVLGTVTFT